MQANKHADVGVCLGCGKKKRHATGKQATPIECQVGEQKFVQPEYMIYECETCGLLYRDPALPEDQLGRYYDAKDFQVWEYPNLQPTETLVLDQLRSLPEGARVLDFGCSSGRLLSRLGENYHRFGCELNETASAVAAQRGLKMVTFEDLQVWTEPGFDAIVMLDVFEHLTSPAELLQQLASLLKPNAKLIVVTGNGDFEVCRRDPAGFWYFRNLEHVCMITRKFSEYLCDRIGCDISAWNELSHYHDSAKVRWKSQAAQWLYWNSRKWPAWLRKNKLVSKISSIPASEIPPPFACGPDHVMVCWGKGAGHGV